nr:TRAP transporter large permease [Oscillospiraceae bacterium]
MDLVIIIPLVCIVTLAVLGCPLWLSIVGGTLPFFLVLEPGLPAQLIAQRMIAMTENSSYLAIPFFVTAGVIMNYSGIAKRLFDLADGLVGHLVGGLAHVNVLISVLMGGVSGSAAADAAVDCKMTVPEMLRRGYDKPFSAAVTLASSLITPIIPPGMGLIIFAFTTQISVGRLLCAGYIPGFLCMGAQMLYCHFYCKKHGYGGSREKMASPKELGKLLLVGFPAILMPFGLIMALRIGMFTATEAGAICALYCLIVGVFVYKEVKLEHVWPIIKESVLGIATVMVLVCSCNALAYFITYTRIPHVLSQAIISMNLNKYSFLLLVNVVLLVIGMFMEGSAPVLILAPLLMPVALELGIDPIHFGLVFIFNVGIGNMTPPFGAVLYQVSGFLDMPLKDLIKASIPFVAIMIGILLLLTFIPQLSLFIPNLIYGT